MEKMSTLEEVFGFVALGVFLVMVVGMIYMVFQPVWERFVTDRYCNLLRRIHHDYKMVREFGKPAKNLNGRFIYECRREGCGHRVVS